jgi:hypothetical protein
MSSAPTPSSTLEDTASESTADHAAAEGAEASDDVGSTSTLREMLLSKDPDPALETVESPWNPEEGGRNRVYRGLKKALGASGMPAVVDVVIGLLEELQALDTNSGDDVDQDESADDQEDRSDPLADTDIGGT